MGASLSRQCVFIVVLCVVHRGAAFAPTSALRPTRGGGRRLVAARMAVDDAPAKLAPGGFRDLTDALPDCPPTVWNAEGIDVAAEHAAGVGSLPTCPIEWVAEGDANARGAAYFAEHSAAIKASLLENGCVWFRGFDLMKDSEGFRGFYEALGEWAEPCLDPIHTSGLRAFADAPNGVYQEVNKPSLRRHYIGLHNESTEKKTATYGAFVCFQPATEEGGEFMIADGAKILRTMDLDVLKRIYENRIRISVSNLDFGGLLGGAGPLQAPLKEAFRQLVATTIAPKFDMELEMQWGTDGNPLRMQAVEGIASPINRHPVTGQPVWFCNIHNHARFLRDRRQCNVPEVGMTDVYNGDLSRIDPDDLLHINEVSEAAIARIPMQPGDVLLCDNYRVLHGRDVFKGDRFHAVSWFRERQEGGDDAVVSKPGNLLNTVINSAF